MTPEHVMAIFGLFNEAMRRSVVSSRSGLSPIDFLVGSQPRVAWSFDPGRRDQAFKPGRHARPALTVSCSAAVLGRLLSSSSLDGMSAGDLLWYGDTGALEALVGALAQPRSINQVRFGGAS
jgi:hypothetical protein